MISEPTDRDRGDDEISEPDRDAGSWGDSGFLDGDLDADERHEPVFDTPTKREPVAERTLGPPVYGSLEQFVTEYLLPVYRRAVSGDEHDVVCGVVAPSRSAAAPRCSVACVGVPAP